MACGRTCEIRGIAKNHKTAIVLGHRTDPGVLDSHFHNMIILDQKNTFSLPVHRLGQIKQYMVTIFA